MISFKYGTEDFGVIFKKVKEEPVQRLAEFSIQFFLPVHECTPGMEERIRSKVSMMVRELNDGV